MHMYLIILQLLEQDLLCARVSKSHPPLGKFDEATFFSPSHL